MSDPPEPLAHASEENRDLQGIATWEPRSLLDKVLARYTWPAMRAVVVLLALLIFLGVAGLLALQALQTRGGLLVLVLFPISVLPAAALVGYVWYTDITGEPVVPLLTTYLLGIVLASFPFLINTVTGAVLGSLFEGNLPLAVAVANFFLVVGPVEEIAKLGAVFAYVYWTDHFDSVVDGAVYGAVAGLGFATIENASYIVQTLVQTQGFAELVVGAVGITTVRSLAGPGHVIWTAIAGFFLGLAKFNDEYRLAITVKGLVIAIVLHALYNTLSTVLGGVAAGPDAGLAGIGIVLGFMIVYHGLAFTYLFLKLRGYRRAYAEVSPGPDAAPISDLDGYGRDERE